MSSFPQFDDRAPDSTRARVQVVRVENEAIQEQLGGTWATLYCCLKCGHLDLYTYTTRTINP